MSNILIIKHGSLGDLIQANGAIKDIKNFYQNRKVFLLTAQPYAIFMSECPYIDGVIIDKRRLSSACATTCDWTNKVADPGFRPTASQSITISVIA